MRVLDHAQTELGQTRQTPSRLPRGADTTTLVAAFVVLQFVLPSTLVFSYAPMSLSPAALVALGLGVVWWCTHLTTSLGAAKGRNPVRTAVFVYALAVLATYGKASLTYLPADERSVGDTAMVGVFAMIFLALAVCDGVRTRERIYFLLRVIVVSAAWVAVVGIIQYLLLFDLTEYLRVPGTHFNERYPLVLARGGLPRVSGTTEHPIEFGVFCAMILPLAVHVAFASGRSGRRSIFWWTCVGVIATGLMFSASRSAILAVGSVGLVLFIGWSGRRRLLMAAAGMVFIVFIKLVSPGLLGTLIYLFRNSSTDDSVRYRTHDYETAREAISAAPLLGRGIGTWYAPKRVVFDNQYLLTLVEAGVIGLLAILGIVVAAMICARQVRRLARQSPDTGTRSTDRDLALALAAALTAVLPTFATFDFAAFATVNSTMFLLAGISGALLRAVRPRTTSDPVDLWQSVVVLRRRWYISLPALLGGLALAGVAYTVTPTQYESVSILTLTTPREGGTISTGGDAQGYVTNPLTNFDRGLNLTAAIVIQEMNSAATAARLGVAADGDIRYEVTNGSATPQLLATGPFIVVRGTGPTPESAVAITDSVADVAKLELAERQQALEAPPSTHIELHPFLPATEAKPIGTSRQRVTAAALAVALLAALTAAFGFESWASRERRGRRTPPPVRERDDSRGSPEKTGAAVLEGTAGR